MPTEKIDKIIQLLEDERHKLFMAAAINALNKPMDDFTDADLEHFEVIMRTGNNQNGTYILLHNEQPIAQFFLHLTDKGRFEYHMKLYLPEGSQSERVH